MYAQLDVEQGRAKIEIGRGVIYGIAAENQKDVNFSGLHIADQIAERFDAINGVRVEWIRVVHGFPHVA